LIELHSAATPNGHRVAILLEECGLPYRLVEVDLLRGDQHSPAFRALNPQGAVPVMVDDGVVFSQSGAMMLHIAEKTGRFLPAAGAVRLQVLQWFMHAISDVSPASSATVQLNVFVAEKQPVAFAHYEAILYKHLSACDARLNGRDWLAGDYSIADMALYPLWYQRRKWIAARGALPHLNAWGERLMARPAVQKGMQAPPFRKP
jgi:glutathione S-transferase